MSDLPLRGLRVVALEQAVAAPFASSRLADAGAEVIKIERPGGDFARGYDRTAKGQSSYFVWLNRGKTSVVADLATPEGKARLAGLIASADVLIQNLKPGALARLGFAAQDLVTQNPRLIVCSVSGYGESGPMAGRKAYDLLIQAETGLCSLTGSPQEAARVGVSVVDIATGATAHAAILEALIRRGVTGRGGHVTVSMFDVMAEWMTVPLLQHEGGQTPRRVGIAHPTIAPYGVFRCADGQEIVISVQSDREWQQLATNFLGQPGLATDPDFATNPRRVANRPRTDGVVAAAFAGRSAAQAIDDLTRADIAFASLNDVASLATHPHLRRIHVATETGEVAMPAPPAVFDDASRRYGPVPAIGAAGTP